MRLPRRKGPAGPVHAVRRTGQPGPSFNYELFNCNNFNIRYWSWNYRGCWPIARASDAPRTGAWRPRDGGTRGKRVHSPDDPRVVGAPVAGALSGGNGTSLMPGAVRGHHPPGQARPTPLRALHGRGPAAHAPLGVGVAARRLSLPRSRLSRRRPPTLAARERPWTLD
ncbi:MAG: hypothetical protein Q9198_005498 [Flavoplaca austrocitrina]